MDSESNIAHVVDNNRPSELHSGCFYSFVHPFGKHHRFFALFFMCWLGFGSYFCYDNPSALQEHITTDMNITLTQFSLLYSLYSWPPVVLCIIGGILIDSVLGIGLGTIIYMGITLSGQLIFAVGAFSNVFWVMALGRFIFGLGSDPLLVAQSNYAAVWFKDKELTMVFGFQQSCSSMAGVINFWVLDALYTWMNNFFSGHQLLGIVLFTASIAFIFSMVCSIILSAIHRKRAKSIDKENKNGDRRIITFKDVQNLPHSFWLLITISVTFYVTFYSFFPLSKLLFMTKFNMTSIAANQLNSISYVIPIFGAPMLGFIIDKVGRSIIWFMIATTCSITGHCMLAFLYWNPYIGVILISTAASIITSILYSLVTLVVPDHQLGTAYGLCWSIQDLFIGLSTLTAGIMVDHIGYVWLQLFCITGSIVSLMVTVTLLMLDAKGNGVLNMTPSERLLFLAASTSDHKILERDISSTVLEDKF